MEPQYYETKHMSECGSKSDKYYKVFNDPDSGDGEILIVHNESQETICIIPAKWEGRINRGWDREKADLVEKALEAYRPE